MDRRTMEVRQRQRRDSEEQDTLAAGLKRIAEQQGHFTWTCDPSITVVLLGQLHLALRHPDNLGLSAEITSQLMRGWIDQLASADAEVGEILRRRFPTDQRMQCEACFPPTFEVELDEVRFAPGYQGEDD